jgi:hypothetical protein
MFEADKHDNSPGQPDGEQSAQELEGRGFNPFRVFRYGDYRFVWSSEALSLWAIEVAVHPAPVSVGFFGWNDVRCNGCWLATRSAR